MTAPDRSGMAIVCGVDFSPDSSRALRCAATIAAGLASPLHVVSGVEPLLVEAARTRGRLPEFLAEVEQAMREHLAPLGAVSVPVTHAIEAGEPAAVLRHAADALNARAIVVGTRGLGRAARCVLGSTTTRLLRSTTRPVIAVPHASVVEPGGVAPWPPINRVVCGVDFSDGALAAARVAAALARDLGASLRLVHAVAPLTVALVWTDLVGDVDADRIAQATARLQSVRDLAASGAEIGAVIGAPDAVLAEAGGHDPSTLIAVGLRGASHHRPGNTALRVLATAGVPVLAVPA